MENEMDKMQELIDNIYNNWADEVELVGSRITCDPAPIGTDQDILVLVTVKKHLSSIVDYLEDEGFTLDCGNLKIYFILTKIPPKI